MNSLTPRERAIARRVRAARKAVRLSQTDVAEALGLSKSGYGHYDRGRQPFTVEQIYQLSRVLGRSVEWLLGLEMGINDDEDKLLTRFRQLVSNASRCVIIETIEQQIALERELSGGQI